MQFHVIGHPLGPAFEYICQDFLDSRTLEGTKLWFALATNVVEHISNNSLFDNSEKKEFSSNRDLVNRDECIMSVRDCKFGFQLLKNTFLVNNIINCFSSAIPVGGKE